MKICKQLRYYVAAMGKRYYYKRATGDMLEAQMILAEARRNMPGEEWEILAIAA